MSAAHTIFEQALAAASVTKAAAINTANHKAQVTIDVQKSAVGFIPGFSSSATLVTTTAAANAQLAIDRANAEAVKQTTEQAARETLRAANSGDFQ